MSHKKGSLSPPLTNQTRTRFQVASAILVQSLDPRKVPIDATVSLNKTLMLTKIQRTCKFSWIYLQVGVENIQSSTTILQPGSRSWPQFQSAKNIKVSRFIPCYRQFEAYVYLHMQPKLLQSVRCERGRVSDHFLYKAINETQKEKEHTIR
jgi:hypothetical protein